MDCARLGCGGWVVVVAGGELVVEVAGGADEVVLSDVGGCEVDVVVLAADDFLSCRIAGARREGAVVDEVVVGGSCRTSCSVVGFARVVVTGAGAPPKSSGATVCEVVSAVANVMSAVSAPRNVPANASRREFFPSAGGATYEPAARIWSCEHPTLMSTFIC